MNNKTQINANYRRNNFIIILNRKILWSNKVQDGVIGMVITECVKTQINANYRRNNFISR